MPSDSLRSRTAALSNESLQDRVDWQQLQKGAVVEVNEFGYCIRSGTDIKPDFSMLVVE